jgi:hypothetical protein
VKTKKIINAIVLLLCAFILVASVSNVLLDNTEVLALAQKAACAGKPKCELYKTSVLRLPIWQTVTFMSQSGTQSVEVRCRRSAIVLGEYSCQPQ